MTKRNSLPPDLSPLEKPALKLNLLFMVDIFRDLSEQEIQEINAMVNMITVKKRRILYSPEEKAEVLFLLKRGKVHLYSLTAEGKRLIIETIGPGTFFGQMPLTAQSMHQTFAEAAEDSLVCVLSRGDLERLLIKKPQVAVRIMERLSQRLEETRTKLEDTTFKSAAARLCQALLNLSQGTSELLGLTHQELGDSTGLYRETVTNVLNRLQAQRLVKLGTKKIIILNKEGLHRVAEG